MDPGCPPPFDHWPKGSARVRLGIAVLKIGCVRYVLQQFCPINAKGYVLRSLYTPPTIYTSKCIYSFEGKPGDGPRISPLTTAGSKVSARVRRDVFIFEGLLCAMSYSSVVRY